jgi:5,10-methylenetetrahydromethanopterin reductase
MAVPFRISVVQLTMEPVASLLELGREVDEAGFDVFWLGEAYPWWRKHAMEARSSTALSALLARETRRVAIGWGIISPYTRHPLQIAMEARVMQEVAGEGRFLLGLGPSKIFMRHAREGDGRPARPLTAVREAVEIVRRALEGEAFSFEGKEFTAEVPALSPEAESPRGSVPIYVAGTAPRIQRASGEIADGLLTASITTPAFVRYARENMEAGAREAGRDPGALDLGSVIVASVDADRDRGRAGAREIAAMYLANKVQNIAGAADVLLEQAGIDPEEIRPVAEALDRGGRRAAAEAVSDELLDRCRPIAGTPSDCIEAIEEYRDAGCSHVLLELWGEDRVGQVRLFGEQVLPHFAGDRAAA